MKINYCKILFLFFLSIYFGLLGMQAQTEKSDRHFWHCQLAGGTYLVAYKSIASISIHDYVVDGVGEVTELTVSTTGQALARFYFIGKQGYETPGGYLDGVTQRAKDLGDKYVEKATGVSPQKTLETQVMKNYPSTTHAHTIEYRLETKEAVQKLYEDLEKRFQAFLKTGSGLTGTSK